MSENAIFPGDKIASIEEYEAGHNAFDDGDMVRAATVGEKDIDKESRTANIKHPKLLSIPQVGDVIIGTVAAVMSSMIAVSIDYINGKPTTSTLKIISHLNGTIHASISEPNLGILFTKCRKCGGKVIPMRDAIKCTDCAWIDERKLSANFGNSDFVNLRG
jgi:exosome complex component CSL4